MQLSSVDLNLLVALDVLLEEGSVSRAAERLHIGQPAMSATLSRLRSLFNDPLLVRRGRTLTTTPFAISLQDPLREALAQLAGVVNAGLAFDPWVDRRVFSIIASDYATLMLVKPLMDRLPEIAPHVQIHVSPVELGAVDRVARREADLLLIPGEVVNTALPVRKTTLFDDTYVCAVDRNHPGVVEDLDPAAFSELPYLVLKVGSLPTMAEARLDALGISRNVEMVAQSFLMAPLLLRNTSLITVIQEKLARMLMPEDTFRLIPVPVDLGLFTESMVWSRQLDPDPGHLWLRQQLEEAGAQL